MTQRQQQALPRFTMGRADRTPRTAPPTSTGLVLLVVILTAEMGDQFFALQVPERVLQFHQLNEQVVLGVQPLRVDRTLEVERKPLLNAVHAGPLGQVQKQGDVKNDRRGED